MTTIVSQQQFYNSNNHQLSQSININTLCIMCVKESVRIMRHPWEDLRDIYNASWSSIINIKVAFSKKSDTLSSFNDWKQGISMTVKLISNYLITKKINWGKMVVSMQGAKYYRKCLNSTIDSISIPHVAHHAQNILSLENRCKIIVSFSDITTKAS